MTFVQENKEKNIRIEKMGITDISAVVRMCDQCVGEKLYSESEIRDAAVNPDRYNNNGRSTTAAAQNIAPFVFLISFPTRTYRPVNIRIVSNRILYTSRKYPVILVDILTCTRYGSDCARYFPPVSPISLFTHINSGR